MPNPLFSLMQQPQQNYQPQSLPNRLNGLGEIIKAINGRDPKQLVEAYMRQNGVSAQAFEQAKRFADQNIGQFR